MLFEKCLIDNHQTTREKIIGLTRYEYLGIYIFDIFKTSHIQCNNSKTIKKLDTYRNGNGVMKMICGNVPTR